MVLPAILSLVVISLMLLGLLGGLKSWPSNQTSGTLPQSKENTAHSQRPPATQRAPNGIG